jgi:uroporphyrinogen decarboxylase
MDPMALYAPTKALRKEAVRVLEQAPPAGHIFNLGHGIQPDAPVEAVQALVEMVHKEGRREP